MTHSFPTRRSSDLRPGSGAARRVGRCHRPAQPLDAHITKALYAARTANSPVNIRGFHARIVHLHVRMRFRGPRPEEQTSEVASLMRTPYSLFCLITKHTH